jgi:hypothetical protein
MIRGRRGILRSGRMNRIFQLYEDYEQTWSVPVSRTMTRRDLILAAATAAATSCVPWISRDITVVAPTTWRTDLLYGYYGCRGDQIAETRDHVNLFMESLFEGPDKAISNILSAGMTTMIDVSWYLFVWTPDGSGRTLRPDAETSLRGYFQALSDAGALRYVRYIYPIDEPNNVTDIDNLTSAIALIKKLAAEFPELNGYKLAVIYAADKPFIGQEMFDLVGFDDYAEKSSILVGQYVALKRSLKPGQKTILVPGGTFLQDPIPFVNFAEQNHEVALVMPFVWFDGAAGRPGIRSNGMAVQYVAAGKSIIGVGNLKSA